MKATAVLFVLALVPQSAGPPEFAAAVAAYDAGRFDAAWDGFAGLLAREATSASVELRVDAALAALRLGRTADASSALGTLRDADAPEVAFSRGMAALQQAERAAAAAALPDAEPMAWTMALRAAQDSVRWFAQADEAHGGWPVALRNAERAARRLLEFAAQQRGGPQAKQEHAPEPPPPPPPSPRGDDTAPGAAAVPTTALTADEVAQLFALLLQRDAKKQRERSTAMRAEATPGARDW